MHAAAEMSASTVNIASGRGLQGQNHTIGGGRAAALPLDFVLCSRRPLGDAMRV